MNRWLHRIAQAILPLSLLLGAAPLLAPPLWGPAQAAGPAPPGHAFLDWLDHNERSSEPKPREFRLINYFFARGTYTNMLADPSGLRGVSLGPLGPGAGVGSATSVRDDTEAAYIEQRWIPVLEFHPRFADGFAAFRAQFEVDYTWGVASNLIQNNQGGGFNADQVNIQTKNVNVALYPTRRPRELSILIGTQSVYDTLYDPTITPLNTIIQTGYKLAFMGSDATGLSAFADTEWGLGKLAFLPLGGAQPLRATEQDPSFFYARLFTADYALRPQPGTVIGLSYWYLADDTRGRSQSFTAVPRGPAMAFVGTRPASVQNPVGSVHYLGAHFHHNLSFATGPISASGFFMLNRGGYKNAQGRPEVPEGGEPLDETLYRLDIDGFAANLELRYHWGKTQNDILTLEGMYTSGDDNPNDPQHSGPWTLNYYGLPGAVWFNHKTLLLMPFIRTVSNYTGAVTDIGNDGYGLATGIFTAQHDLIPDNLHLKVGAAWGQTTADTALRDRKTGDIVRERGRGMGLEINAEIEYSFRYLLSVGLHVGYLFRGDFYDNNPQVTEDPWAAFTTFTWYGF